MHQICERLSAALVNASHTDSETLAALLRDGMDIEDPDLKHQHMMFLEKIRSQQRRLEQYITSLDSVSKNNAPLLFRPISGDGFSENAQIRYCVTAYTMTHMAIAAYIVLITLADKAEMEDISAAARESLHQKMAMASYFEDYIAQTASEAPVAGKVPVHDTADWGSLLAPVDATIEYAPLH